MIPGRAIPNIITVARIALCPVIFVLLFVPTFTARFIAWILFLIAAFSDLFDGHLARKHGWISDFGKLVDPIADKLLLVATFIPFYILSNRDPSESFLPIIDRFPLWIMLVVFGRELFVTVFRSFAARRGVVIAAGSAGKHKAVWQNIFIGTAIFWYALQSAALNNGWTGQAWDWWQQFHGVVFIISLVVAVLLTVYSMVVYMKSWSKLRLQ
ncbi:MAG TPA: CDP-diacylglycerol--glycerol-3-phosphate 3-phosphatidyltransferase [Longimicrobiales bacterium]